MVVGPIELLPVPDAVGLLAEYVEAYPDVPAAAWDPYRELYPELFAAESWRLPCNCFLMRSEGATILVDTGVGPPGLWDWTAEDEGELPEALARLGVRPDDVDIVFLTHLHIDHVGWAVRDSKPFFPRARHIVPRADWEYFRAPERAAENAHVVAMEAIDKAGMIELVEGERALTDEVTLLPTPGHTPGHQSLVVASGGERAYIVGDVVHHPAQLQETAWCPAFDDDKAAATASRRKLLERIEAERSLFAACHFPAPGFGRIAVVQGRRLYQAL